MGVFVGFLGLLRRVPAAVWGAVAALLAVFAAALRIGSLQRSRDEARAATARAESDRATAEYLATAQSADAQARRDATAATVAADAAETRAVAAARVDHEDQAVRIAAATGRIDAASGDADAVAAEFDRQFTGGKP